MLTPENILLFIVFIILLINIQTIVTTIVFYFQDIQDPVVTIMDKDEIEETISKIIKPYEEMLFSQGFKYHSQLSITNMMVKNDTLQYSFYYYNPSNGIHAFIDTTPFKGCLRGATISYATFYESYNIAITFDCFKHNIIADPNKIYIFDHYYGSFEKAYESHLLEREIEGEVATQQQLTTEGVNDYSIYVFREMIEKSIEKNIIKTTSNGYRFLATTSFYNYTNHLIKGYKKATNALKEHNITQRDTIEKNSDKKHSLYRSSEQIALTQQLEEKSIESSQTNKIKIFLFSALSFVLFFGLIGIPWSGLPIIIAILLIHELGHFWAMKFFGYKDTSIFFIPLFGAAAKGEKDETTPFEEYIVFMAGPLPGIIISIGIGIILIFNPELRSNELLKEFAIMSLAINYINLLPIYPLDGGKIVQTLLFTRYPKAQFYFFLISLLVIIIATLMLKSILLGFLAVVLFLSINHSHKTSQLIATVINQKSDTPLKQKVIETLTSDEKYRDESLAKKGSMAKQALKILNTKKPTLLLMVIGLGFYLMLVLSPLIIKMVLPLNMG
jgi:Zn-dependent protease